MFDLLLRTKTFTVEMIISKKVGNHFLLGNGSQPPKKIPRQSSLKKKTSLKYFVRASKKYSAYQ